MFIESTEDHQQKYPGKTTHYADKWCDIIIITQNFMIK